MKASAFCAVLSIAATSAMHVISPDVQPDYIAPAAATSYIYRSDNNGPASLIQLGGHYQQPHAFAPPLPLATRPISQPIGIVPQPVYEVPLEAPVAVLDADTALEVDDADDIDDDDYADSGEYLVADHGLGDGHGYEKEAGNDYGEEHHAAHGEKGSKGYSSKGIESKGAAGHYDKGGDEASYLEEGGEVSEEHDVADVQGAHHEGGKQYKGGAHGHKKHFSKGEQVTGYHKVFNKDEFKKDHDFYDVADNSGHFNKHGFEEGHNSAEEAAHKAGGHQDAAYSKGEAGKAGYHAKGHRDDTDQGHSAEEGEESYYNNETDYGKKGGSAHAKEAEYVDGDDEDY